MALAVTVVRDFWKNTPNDNPYDTNDTAEGNGAGTNVLTAGRLYVVQVSSYSAGAAELPTSVVFDPGGADEITFAKVNVGGTDAEQTGMGGTGDTHSLWWAVPSATTAASFWRVTFGATQSAGLVAVEEWTGFDATGTFVQLVINSGSGTSASASMAAYGATDNAAVLYVFGDTHDTTMAPDEGRTELYDTNDAERSIHGMHYANPHGSDQSLTATLSASQAWGTFGLEIKAAAAGTSIDAQPGSYAATGAAAVFGLAMAALAGAYSVSGAPATTQRAVPTNAGPGAYVVTGSAAGADIGFHAEAGGYVVTGFSATTQRDVPTNAGPGSYAVAGVAATAQRDVPANAGSGAYVLTGFAATTVAPSGDTPIDAQPGSYAVTGAAATTDIAVPALPATYGITGAPATLLVGRVSVAEPTTYTVGGVDATTVYTPTGVDRYGSVQGWGPGAIDMGLLKMGQRLGRSVQGTGPGADYPDI